MSQDVFDKAKTLAEEIKTAAPGSPDEIEQYRIKYLGTKGALKGLFQEIRNVENTRKKEFGLLVNAIKQEAEQKLNALKDKAETAAESGKGDLDLTAPGEPISLGSRHPISIMMNEMISIFERIGFVVAEDREIEDDWHNFTALNSPEDHPARDMQDTFYIMNDPKMLLRSHTSSVQARVMTAQKPPIRIIAPGRVYRNETISARSHCQFHQIEGLYIDENVSFADMKQTLYYFAKTYRLTKGTGWLEILGCGMVDPAVLENCGIDSDKYTGYAWGMGIERPAMIKYGIPDIRYFFENDIRFLKQFSSAI